MSRSDTKDPLEYLDDVLRYAFARLGSREEAEDVAMEVFHAAFRFRSQLPKRKDPRLYLIGITRRKIADHLRRQVRERGRGTASIEDPAFKDSGYETSQEIIEAFEALKTLPELQRDALILKYFHGFSTKEIGQILKKSPEAINSLLQRGRDGISVVTSEQEKQGQTQRRIK